MALDLNSTYGATAAPVTAGYPQGEPNNSTSPGAFNGFPLEEAWLKDVYGFLQKLLDFTSITPSGSPDSITASDYFDALIKIAVPIGSVTEYVGNVVPNTFWAFCNYATKSKTTYASLFAITAHRYAKTKADRDAADGGGNFHLPDFRDLYLRGGLNESFANTAINISTERITITGHSFTRDGTPVRFFTDGTLPAVITALTNRSWETLYLRVIDANTVELYDTEANAIDTSGTTGRLNFADQGTGTHDLTQQGIIITDAMQGHWHDFQTALQAIVSVGPDTNALDDLDGSGFTSTAAVRNAITDTLNGTPRLTNETRPQTGFTRKIIKLL